MQCQNFIKFGQWRAKILLYGTFTKKNNIVDNQQFKTK